MKTFHTLAAVFAALCAVLAAVALRPPAARADSDPAASYLAIRPVFVPAGTSHAAEAELARVVAASDRAGAPIKVAVIGSIYDLGPITLLWQKPHAYAPFLGGELSAHYAGLLLVEMPDGFGLYRGGRSVTAEGAALARVPIGSGSAGMVASAEHAIAALAAVRGHPLPPLGTILARTPAAATAGGSRPGGGVSPLVTVLALAAGVLLIALSWIYSVRRRPPVRLRPHRALLALAPVVLVAIAVVEFTSASRSSPAADTSPRPGIATNQVRWPAGLRMAPGFDLRDQNGTPVSLRSLRGHVTILAFLDPVCRDLCPLEATILGRVAHSFGASARPAVVAISVNPWGDAHAVLAGDMQEWGVGADWRWAIGSRAALERVWKTYGVGVKVSTMMVAGTRVHEVDHVAMIYVLDRTGHERDAFLYPFSVSQVASAVRALGGSNA